MSSKHRGVLLGWSKKLESEGFNVSVKNIATSTDGVSFSCKVDMVSFLNHYDPDESRYPRVKEEFKQNKFSVEITKDEQCVFPTAMDVRIENVIEAERDDTGDVAKLCGQLIEGGDLVDKVAEVGDWVLSVAKEHATNIFKDIGGN